jgi:hypothetical protein
VYPVQSPFRLGTEACHIVYRKSLFLVVLAGIPR